MDAIYHPIVLVNIKKVALESALLSVQAIARKIDESEKNLEKVKKENEPHYDEDNYLCLVQISDSEINKK